MFKHLTLKSLVFHLEDKFNFSYRMPICILELRDYLDSYCVCSCMIHNDVATSIFLQPRRIENTATSIYRVFPFACVRRAFKIA